MSSVKQYDYSGQNLFTMGSDNDIGTTVKIQIRDSDVLNFSIKLFILKFIIMITFISQHIYEDII